MGLPSRTYQIYDDETVTCWLAHIDGTFTFHVQPKVAITKEVLGHFATVFFGIIAALESRGFDHLDTWIYPEDKNQLTFAKYFGFEETGLNKLLTYTDKTQHLFQELRYTFPKE